MTSLRDLIASQSQSQVYTEIGSQLQSSQPELRPQSQDLSGNSFVDEDDESVVFFSNNKQFSSSSSSSDDERRGGGYDKDIRKTYSLQKQRIFNEAFPNLSIAKNRRSGPGPGPGPSSSKSRLPPLYRSSPATEHEFRKVKWRKKVKVRTKTNRGQGQGQRSQSG